MVEVTGGEWPRGRTNTLKVSHPQRTVPTEGERPWGWGVLLIDSEQPRGRVLAKGGQAARQAASACRGRVAPLLTEGEQLKGPCSSPQGRHFLARWA